ncbi:MAG: hypothetical protein ACI4HZ_03765 [Ruminococcus sp.]
MLFNLHDFILNTLKGMVGNYPQWQVQEYALNWYSKGKLTEADLATVESWYTAEETEETTAEIEEREEI